MSSALLPEALSPLCADPAASAILLDIDGTLAPIVEHAAEASVPEATRRLLMQIVRKYGLVACVSGRRASEARAMVSIGAITYLGSHGAELLKAGWTQAQLDPGLAEWEERIRAFVAGLDMQDLRRGRVRLEDKAAITAFHWRGAPDEERALDLVRAVAEQAQASGLATHWGRKVLEVRPPVRIDKGAGVRALLAETEIRNAMYVGDDVTDLDAFHALLAMRYDRQLEHVVRVGVRSEDGPRAIVDEADVVVDGTDGVRDLLSFLLTDAGS